MTPCFLYGEGEGQVKCSRFAASHFSGMNFPRPVSHLPEYLRATLPKKYLERGNELMDCANPDRQGVEISLKLISKRKLWIDKRSNVTRCL